jgi:Kef-type K+ transport system membrane component KefB
MVYGLMIAATVLLYFLIRAWGDRLLAPAPALGQPTFIGGKGDQHVDDMLHVLLALVVVIVLARAIGTLFRRFQQPQVVGEILAGIMLGPSLLGHVWPAGFAYLLPPAVAPFLNVLSQVGVILYMFLVGLELDPTLLRKRGHAAVAISHASIIAPFLLGALLALLIYPQLSSADVPFTYFSLFVGVSMSVTAFPVLARILTDRGIHKSRMGAIALTCAAVDDVTAWCLLAFAVGVVQAHGPGALLTAGGAVVYIALMFFVVRPAMTRLTLLYGNRGRLTQGVMATVFVTLLLSSLATDLIGIHAIFGAFALGAVIPHDSGLARDLTDRLEDVLVVLLLPAFFAFTGLRTQVGLVSGLHEWMLCGLVIAIASLGKFGGSCVAARLTGLGWRDSSALGVLMNTRGLMELIVLNIGFELKVISPTLFAMLVLMALVTTFATTPILHFIARDEELAREPEERVARPAPARLERLKPVEVRRVVVHADRPRSAAAAPHGILVPIANPLGVVPLIDLALAARRHEDPPPHVLSLARIPAGAIRSGLRELEQRVPPRAAALMAALEHAQDLGEHVTHQSVWSADPAADIVRSAVEHQSGWILMGSHRPVFGADFRGGVVRQVLEGVKGTPVQVGVLVYGPDQREERIFAVVDPTADGRAVLDLAVRIALRKQSALRALLVPARGNQTDHHLLEMVKTAGHSIERRLHTDVLAERSASQIAQQTPGSLVIIGASLVEEVGLPGETGRDAHRSIVVVQGTEARSEDVSGKTIRRTAP